MWGCYLPEGEPADSDHLPLCMLPVLGPLSRGRGLARGWWGQQASSPPAAGAGAGAGSPRRPTPTEPLCAAPSESQQMAATSRHAVLSCACQACRCAAASAVLLSVIMNTLLCLVLLCCLATWSQPSLLCLLTMLRTLHCCHLLKPIECRRHGAVCTVPPNAPGGTLCSTPAVSPKIGCPSPGACHCFPASRQKLNAATAALLLLLPCGSAGLRQAVAWCEAQPAAFQALKQACPMHPPTRRHPLCQAAVQVLWS